MKCPKCEKTTHQHKIGKTPEKKQHGQGNSVRQKATATMLY